jgi:hypothetical protein
MKDKAVRAECQGKKTKDENVSGLSSAYRVFLHEELHNIFFNCCFRFIELREYYMGINQH